MKTYSNILINYVYIFITQIDENSKIFHIFFVLFDIFSTYSKKIYPPIQLDL